MKIKKIFSLASVVSLGILLTACTNKNSSILNNDILKSESITLEEYKKEIETKKSVESVFKDKSIYDTFGGIIIAYDDDYYYAYNLNLDNKEILKVARINVYDIKINQNAKSITVTYVKGDETYYGYELYAFDGKCLFDMMRCYSFGCSYQGRESRATGIFTIDSIGTVTITYTSNINGSLLTRTKNYYYVDKENSIKLDKTPTKFLSEDEYYEEYGKLKKNVFDGEGYGLKGYQIERISRREYYIYKNDKLVNHLVLTNDVNLEIVNDGNILFQTKEEVTKNDKYDVFYDEEYLVINTYKINMLTSKVTKIKDFHYLITTCNDTAIVDGKLEGAVCELIDYKAKKNAIKSDNKLALVKSNGNIKFHEAMNAEASLTISVDKEYYFYNLDDDESDFSGEATVVYNKNGDVKKTYEGIYYENVLAKADGTRLTFFNNENKGLTSLTDYTRINLGKYIGLDINNKKVLVEINNGNVTTTDITGYQVYNNTFFFKSNGTTTDAYSLDSTLTNLGFDYTEISTLTNDCYKLSTSTGSSVVQVK